MNIGMTVLFCVLAVVCIRSAAKSAKNSRKIGTLSREQERQRREQERQRKQLEKHEEQITRLQFQMARAEEEINHAAAEIERLQRYALFCEEQRDKCTPNSAEWYKWDNKLSVVDGKVYYLDQRRAKAAFTIEQARQKIG